MPVKTSATRRINRLHRLLHCPMVFNLLNCRDRAATRELEARQRGSRAAITGTASAIHCQGGQAAVRQDQMWVISLS